MPHLALYGNAIVPRDGAYIQPAWGRFDLKKEPKRVSSAQRELWSAFWKDRGRTWSPPVDSGMRGSTPWLVATNTGLVVAVYIRREKALFPSTGIFACVSWDNGRSWDVEHEAMLPDNGTTRVDGYPQAVAPPEVSP